MNYSIRNENISVTVSSLGAELQSIKKNNHEYLWQGDAKFWAGRAPILFPIVGGLKNKEYLLNGQKYSMPNHGVVRINEFQNVEVSDSAIIMTLTSTPEIKKMYPFDFTFKVAYELQGSKLFITHTITNDSNEDMPYVFGLHPGFNLDDELQNSYVQLDDEPLISNIDNEGGFMVHKTVDYGVKDLCFNQNSFERDNVIIFDNLKSREATLCFKNSDKKVQLQWNDDLPLLAIWSKNGSSFVCIEPWSGLADFKDDTINELAGKDRAKILKPQESTDIKYSIEVF